MFRPPPEFAIIKGPLISIRPFHSLIPARWAPLFKVLDGANNRGIGGLRKGGGVRRTLWENRLTLNDTDFVTVTKTFGVFSWFVGDEPVMKN